jgi:periplasmic protein TonB
MTEFADWIGPKEVHHTHGWAVSVICHLLAVGGAFLVGTEIEKPLLRDAFHWDVSVVERPATSEPPADVQDNAAPIHQAFKENARETVAKRVTSSTQMAPETVHHVETRQINPQQLANAVESEHEVVTRDQQPSERSTVQRTLNSEERRLQEIATPIVAASAVERSERVDAPRFIDSSDRIKRLDAVKTVSPDVETLDRVIEQRLVQRRLVQYRNVQADYGWLAGAIRARIEELKRYPLEAKRNHWEGKVVVEAVICEDGTVASVQIKESSGRDILDQEAMSVIRKASPLNLKYPLGRQQVTILVPITYQLNS